MKDLNENTKKRLETLMQNSHVRHVVGVTTEISDADVHYLTEQIRERKTGPAGVLIYDPVSGPAPIPLAVLFVEVVEWKGQMEIELVGWKFPDKDLPAAA